MKESHSFPETRWTLVLNAQEDCAEALGKLCQSYWYPLYGHVRHLGYAVDDAEDLTQAFFEQLLSAEGIKHARRERGRLRSYLIRAIDNFAKQDWRRKTRLKRGGGQAMVAIDALSAEARLALEPQERTTPEAEFDRRWAQELMRQAHLALVRVYDQEGKPEIVNAFRYQFDESLPPRPYREVGEELGMTEAAARFTAMKLRKRYRQLLMEAITDTVPSQEDVGDEFTYLLGLIGTVGGV